MLRQIHVFFKKEHIFVKDYARAFGQEELKNILETIDKYMENPVPGKILNRKISNFQILHKGEEKLYFIFVTDLIDSLQDMENKVTETFDKFHELFPDPAKIEEDLTLKGEFINFLDQIQKEMHSKISIIGPVNAGKTTLYNLLKTNNEHEIMDFAKSSTLEIDGAYLELWDFQLSDNFSPLWPKFISGSDLVILLFSLANYNLKIINHFLNLQKLESKYSKLLLIANKRDLISDEDIKRIKNELNISDFEEFSLKSPEAISQIQFLIKGILGLKEELPQNFNEMVKEAEGIENLGYKAQALAKYKELVNICSKYQDFDHITIFQQKVDELTVKIKEQADYRKGVVKDEEFQIPLGFKMKRKITVKPLPVSTPAIDSLAEEKIEEETPPLPKTSLQGMVSFKKLEPETSDLKIIKTIDIPKPKKVATPQKLEGEKEKKPKAKMPIELFPPHEDIGVDLKKPKITDFVKELQNIITKKGSSLSLKLCEKLIIELEQSLGRPLTMDDVHLAADFFVKQEQMK
ncbi:MAG: GTPase domain-containing protein [Candidatus Thorarchaeota archaeon]